MRGLSLSLLLMCVAAVPAGAVTFDAPPDGIYSYAIEHSEHGALGTHVVTIESQGDERHVRVERHIKVERVWVTVYREDTETEELWRDRELVRFWRETSKGDKTTELTVEARNGELVFADTGKSTGLPVGTFPTHPWDPEIVEQSVLMSTDDGHAIQVSTKRVGEEQVSVGGSAIAAERFEMVGGERRTLWYDGLGRLVRQVIHNADGSTITFTLQRLPS